MKGKATERRERCTKHANSLTTKKLGGFIQVLTRDELLTTSRDKKRNLASNFEEMMGN